jgi:creatinine amidohydrolase
MGYIKEYMTVKDIEEALKKTKTVIIPFGCVEQHGYHLPLSTDMHFASEIPRRAADRLNAVIAPTIPYTFSGGELPGTVNVSPQVFSLYMTDICSEFARMGFRNIVIYIGHGGTDNLDVLKSTLVMLLRRNKYLSERIIISLLSCTQFSKTLCEAFKSLEDSDEKDFHAGWFETSLMMYWKPELVRDDMVVDEPEVVKMLRTDCDWYAISEGDKDDKFIIPKVRQREEVKIGVMGFPEKATRELGEKISKEMEEGLINYINKLNAKYVWD